MTMTEDGTAAPATDAEAEGDAEESAPDDNDDDSDVRAGTPGRGVRPEARAIESAAPEEFGLVQAWWGDGKGKTTAALGMAMRAVGHGYRVHVCQFMKGGADSVEDVRGEYNAIAALPGFSYENLGHYGWHAMPDGSDDRDHSAEATAGLERARELVAAAADADLSAPFDLDGDADDGMHMLVLDEILYAAERELVAPDAVRELVESKPDGLELVLTGGHSPPEFLGDAADLVSEVRKERHPIDAGQRARKGTEY
jgi:cob(I)alamin adenosyltransferase